MKTLEERYWDIWTKDDDLTHIDDKILKFIKKEIRRREKEWTNSKSGIDGSIYGKGTGRDGSVY